MQSDEATFLASPADVGQHGQTALPWQCPSSPPVPPLDAPGGSGQLGTPRAGLGQWDPSHRLGGSSEPHYSPKGVGRFHWVWSNHPGPSR